MELLGIKQTFSSGVQFKMNVDSQNKLFISLSGAPLQAMLEALEISSLDLSTTQEDMVKLRDLLTTGLSLARQTGISG